MARYTKTFLRFFGYPPIRDGEDLVTAVSFPSAKRNLVPLLYIV